MEKTDEVSGAGNSYTAEFWQYDPRIGRRWNIDPVLKVWESPYATFNNNPILISDVKGDDGEPVIINANQVWNYAIELKSYAITIEESKDRMAKFHNNIKELEKEIDKVKHAQAMSESAAEAGGIASWLNPKNWLGKAFNATVAPIIDGLEADVELLKMKYNVEVEFTNDMIDKYEYFLARFDASLEEADGLFTPCFKQFELWHYKVEPSTENSEINSQYSYKINDKTYSFGQDVPKSTQHHFELNSFEKFDKLEIDLVPEFIEDAIEIRKIKK
jgi:hypothetical protein